MVLMAIKWFARDNQKVLHEFIKVGSAYPWPDVVFSMYKNYFKYMKNEVGKKELEIWMKRWKSSSEHVELILQHFTLSDLLAFESKYEEWYRSHNRHFTQTQLDSEFPAIKYFPDNGTTVQKVMFFMYEDLSTILKRI